jgi:hypothetical protein
MKDFDPLGARWMPRLGLEEFYLVSLRIQQIPQVPFSKF